MLRRILHVVDRLSGGVPVAVRDYITHAPADTRHTLLSPYVDGRPAGVWSGLTADFLDLGSNRLAHLRAIRRTLRDLQPDLVHAHSSFPGLLTRIVGIPVGVVYSPHCFKFDDPGASPLLRHTVRSVESLLARRTARFAILSEHEADLVRSLDSRAETVLVPNTPSVEVADRRAPDASRRIGMVGRLAPQKDPDFFLKVCARVGPADVEGVWIGDGTTEFRSRLEASGVRVTGWLRKEEVSEHLDQLAVYVHTASYEGFPLSVLDAAARGIPVVAREIPALQAAGLATFRTPDEAADLIRRCLTDIDFREALIDAGEQMLDAMNDRTQRDALDRAWTVPTDSEAART